MSLLQSVDDIIRLFESGGCQHVVIGEIAVLLHGGRASTIDFDLYILADDFKRVEKHLTDNGCNITMKADHQLRLTFAGIQIDVLEADAVLGATIFGRSVRRKIVNAECNVATPEDIIILKTLAARPIDRRDVAELREIFAGALNETYISSTLKQFQ